MKLLIPIVILSIILIGCDKQESEILNEDVSEGISLNFQLNNYDEGHVLFTINGISSVNGSVLIDVNDSTDEYLWLKEVSWEGDSTKIHIHFEPEIDSNYQFTLFVNHRVYKTYKSDTIIDRTFTLKE